MKHYLKSFIIAAVALLTSVSAQAEPDQKAQALFERLMAATISNDYDGFIAECDAKMKAALTKSMLAGVSEQITPRAKNGYDAQYFGELKQQGYSVHLWRVRFKFGGDDVLATLSVKDEKVGGFYLK